MIFTNVKRRFIFPSTVLILAMLCFATSGSAQEDGQEKVMTLFREGIELQKKNDIDGAIAKYSEAIKLAGKTGELYLTRGIAYLGKHDNDSAINDFSKALELGLSDKEAEAYARRFRATINIDREKYKEAVDDLNLVIAQFTNDTKDFTYRGKAHLMLKKSAEALSDLNKAIELDPKNELAFYWRAGTYTELNMLDKAISDYSSVIGINPTGPNYFSKRAELYKRLGKNEAAAADEKKAAELRASPKQ